MWMSTILYVVVLLLFSIWFYKYATYKPKNFPPGPLRFPLYGSYWLSLLIDWNFPHIVFQKWAKKYGSIFGMYIGNELVVVTNDYDTCKAVFNNPEFDGKPDIVASRTRNIGFKRLGVFFTDGQFWHEQRRFALRNLRDYGFGRRFERLETLMNEQIQHLIEFIKYATPNPKDSDILRNDKAIKFPEILFPCQMNAARSVFGLEPAQHGTDKYRKFRDIGRGIMLLQKGAFSVTTFNITPWMKYIAPKTIGYHNLKESNKIIFPHFKALLEEIKNTRVDDDEVRCFFDLYYNKMKENKQKNITDSSFTEDQLMMLTIDFMFPAVSAIPVVIVQIIFSLLNHPECQEKMQKEIDEVVGRGRLPTLDDRPNMPYTEAIIKEVSRKETLVPLGIIHKVLNDTKFRGYDIPKNALIFTNLYAAHMDEKVWGDPKNFRPERFIDKATNTMKKGDKSLAFGSGKRLCAGETFAKNSIFLLASALYQNFSFKMAGNVQIPKLENKVPALVNSQRDECWVYAIPRDS